MIGILGRKVGMTQIIQDDGCVIPLTVVECKPNIITQIKTTAKDGYPAVVLGFSQVKKETKTKKFYHLREFQVAEKETENFKKGEEINLEVLKEVKEVTITGVSKGKGFQGVIKRHNFSRGPETHGSHHHREPGSVGACAKPGRIHKGKKMPGRMGSDQKTTRSQIVYLKAEKNLIGIKGPIPGARNSLVIIKPITS